MWAGRGGGGGVWGGRGGRGGGWGPGPVGGGGGGGCVAGAVAAAIEGEPEVEQAVVVAREDAAVGRRLVAYVVPRAGAALDGAAVRARLRATLPDYMVPAAVVTLARLPLTANGKLDRAALPAPTLEGRAGGAGAGTGGEDVLAEIWTQVLGAAPVGVDDNFFALGGHSLLATQVAAQIQRVFGGAFALAVPF